MVRTSNTIKALIFLLILCLTLPLAASCAPSQPSESSSGASEAVSENSDTSDAESEEESREPFEPKFKTIVSHGKSYKPSSEPHGGTYPDTYGSELTDGVFASSVTSSYTDEAFTGFADAGLSIVIDMGEDTERLYCFEASYLSMSTAGISAPSTILVSISDDGKEWTKLGRCSQPTYVEATTQSGTLTLDYAVSGRYVKFAISRSATWIFLDELTVYADIEGSTNINADIGALYEADTATDAELTAALAAVTTDAPDKTLVKSLISKNASYMLSRSSSSKQHTDDGKMLTDGAAVGTRYESEAWVGFEGKEALDITITLPSVQNDISSIELSAYSRTTTGIYLPACVDILVSEDGAEYTRIARIYSSTDTTMTNFTYAFTPSKCIKARYIRFSIPESEREWMLFEEAAVYAYREAEQDRLYPAVTIEKVSGEDHWPSGTDDYAEKINLIAGRKQQILDGANLTYSEAHELNTPASSGLLTDGVKSQSPTPGNGTWFKFWSGSTRDIFYDLEKHSTVTGFSVGFLYLSSWGISLPGSVTLYLSDDGVNWYSVRTEETVSAGDPGVCRVSVLLAQPTVARYARFSFSFSPHAYVDEIELFGTKEIKRGVTRLDGLGLKSTVLFGDDGQVGEFAAPDKDILGGAEDILLAYHATEKVLDKDYFLAYAAYLDGDLKIADTMFDSFLFLPSTGTLPSGGRPYGESVMSDWEYIFNDLFKDGRNLDALNEAAGQIKSELGLKNYKVKVFATLMHPSAAITKFGDVDGDGVTENLSKLDDIQKVVEWYVEKFEKEFNSKKYENLELCGYYWFHEAINADSDDVKAIQNASAYLNSRSSQLFWIPYYTASGYRSWSSYGFSAAYMQPNLAFNADVPLSRIGSAVNLIRRYNMAIEIEVSSDAFTNDLFYAKYMEYLKGGVIYGYMEEAAHAYYQDITFFYNACHSGDPRKRLLYDLTYDFIKGTLEINPEKPADVSLSAESDKSAEGKLGEVSVIRKYRIESSPSHGTVSVNDDGTFTYYPNKGYTGSDSFTFSVSEGLDWSEPASVTVTVG